MKVAKRKMRFTTEALKNVRAKTQLRVSTMIMVFITVGHFGDYVGAFLAALTTGTFLYAVEIAVKSK